jgi:hypothetical protein
MNQLPSFQTETKVVCHFAYPLSYICVSGREDLNLRPHGPKPCALTGLSYAPNEAKYTLVWPDRQGNNRRLKRPG